MPRVKSTCLAALLGCASLVPLVRAQYGPLIQDSRAEERIDWWRQARFGMFIHWGVYAIPGRGEWVQWNESIPAGEYAKLADQFHAEHFDANTWAAVARSGGMKYVVLTSRHHDGFALFDDPGSSFTAVKSAAHKDIVAEYVQAMRKAGLRVGLYYSPLDWRFPGYFMPDFYRESADQLRAQYARQIEGLGSHYGKLDILWFDGGGDHWLGFGGLEHGKPGGWHDRPKDAPYTGKFDWEDAKTVARLRQLQPDLILNDRTDAAADFRSREGDAALGSFNNVVPWELCTTITEGAWGFQPDAKVKPLATLIRLLVGAAGRDGNMLLNVGPQPDGQIPPAQVERIREIGQWLNANGESIYGTRGGPWTPGPYGASTHKGRTVYIHVLEPPKDGLLKLPVLPAKIISAALMNGTAVPFKVAGSTLSIELPSSAIDARSRADTVVKLTLDQPWNTTAVVPVLQTLEGAPKGGATAVVQAQ